MKAKYYYVPYYSECSIDDDKTVEIDVPNKNTVQIIPAGQLLVYPLNQETGLRGQRILYDKAVEMFGRVYISNMRRESLGVHIPPAKRSYVKTKQRQAIKRVLAKIRKLRP